MANLNLRDLKINVELILKKAGDDQLGMHASSLAFSSVLSIIPITALAYFFFDAFGGFAKLQGQIQNFVLENLAPAFGDKISVYTSQIHGKISSGAIGIFGLIGFIYTSFSMLFKMEASFNYIWKIKKMRPMVRRITNHWAVITLSPILIAASISSTTYAIGWLRNDNGDLARILLFVFTFLPYAVMVFLFTTIYIVVPATNVDKKAAFIGGLVSGLIFEFAKQLYAIYATDAIGKSVYGSLAILPVFLVWIQFAWYIMLIGAEIASYFHFKRRGFEANE